MTGPAPEENEDEEFEEDLEEYIEPPSSNQRQIVGSIVGLALIGLAVAVWFHDPNTDLYWYLGIPGILFLLSNVDLSI